MKAFAVDPVPTPTTLSLRKRGLIIAIAASAAARFYASALIVVSPVIQRAAVWTA